MNPTEQLTRPLQDGERISRDEFDRRAEAMPGVRGIELIEGVVHVTPRIRFFGHSNEHGMLTTILGMYRFATPGVRFGPPASIRLDPANAPEPDAVLFIDPSRGGGARYDGGYLAGSPELVAEVAFTTTARDLNLKMPVYEHHGIREYVVWRVEDGELDWFALRDGCYQLLAADAGGVVRSEAFPGLRLDIPAMLADVPTKVEAVLREGLASPEHAAFVVKLQQAKP